MEITPGIGERKTPKCCVKKCLNHEREGKASRLHNLPDNEDIANIWLINLKGGLDFSKKDKNFLKKEEKIFVCSDHFADDFFQTSPAGNLTEELTSDAVPTIFPWTTSKRKLSTDSPRTKAMKIRVQRTEENKWKIQHSTQEATKAAEDVKEATAELFLANNDSVGKKNVKVPNSHKMQLRKKDKKCMVYRKLRSRYNAKSVSNAQNSHSHTIIKNANAIKIKYGFGRKHHGIKSLRKSKKAQEAIKFKDKIKENLKHSKVDPETFNILVPYGCNLCGHLAFNILDYILHIKTTHPPELDLNIVNSNEKFVKKNNTSESLASVKRVENTNKSKYSTPPPGKFSTDSAVGISSTPTSTTSKLKLESPKSDKDNSLINSFCNEIEMDMKTSKPKSAISKLDKIVTSLLSAKQEKVDNVEPFPQPSGQIEEMKNSSSEENKIKTKRKMPEVNVPSPFIKSSPGATNSYPCSTTISKVVSINPQIAIKSNLNSKQTNLNCNSRVTYSTNIAKSVCNSFTSTSIPNVDQNSQPDISVKSNTKVQSNTTKEYSTSIIENVQSKSNPNSTKVESGISAILKSNIVTMPDYNLVTSMKLERETVATIHEAFETFPYLTESEYHSLSQITGVSVKNIETIFATARVQEGISWEPHQIAAAASSLGRRKNLFTVFK